MEEKSVMFLKPSIRKSAWIAAALLALVSVSCGAKSTGGASPSPAGAPDADYDPAADPDRASKLVFLTICAYPQEFIDKKAEFVQFMPYVAKNMAAYGIKDVKLVRVGSPSQAAVWLRDGKADFFDESPFSSYLANQLTGADEPFLNRWKYGSEKFTGVIFTKKQGGANSLDGLKGKMIVLKDPTSTANYFLPKWYLISHGYKPVEKKDLKDPVAPDEIGYWFNNHSRDREIEMVMDGVVAAGGVSNEFIEKLLSTGADAAAQARHPRPGAAQAKLDDLRILARGDTALRRLLTVRKALDPRVKAAVKELLLNMHQNPEGQAILKTFGPSTQFSLADTPENAYQGIIDKPKEVLQAEVATWRAEMQAGR
jgi:ABC-type phosphate/phosphonate transport system substrate-binding protein